MPWNINPGGTVWLQMISINSSFLRTWVLSTLWEWFFHFDLCQLTEVYCRWSLTSMKHKITQYWITTWPSGAFARIQILVVLCMKHLPSYWHHRCHQECGAQNTKRVGSSCAPCGPCWGKAVISEPVFANMISTRLYKKKKCKKCHVKVSVLRTGCTRKFQENHTRTVRTVPTYMYVPTCTRIDMSNIYSTFIVKSKSASQKSIKNIINKYCRLRKQVSFLSRFYSIV